MVKRAAALSAAIWRLPGGKRPRDEALSWYNDGSVLRKILHLITYATTAGLAIFLFAMSVLVLIMGSENFALTAVPWWTGQALAKVLLVASLFAIAATALAAKGKLPGLLALWSVAVFGVLAYAYFYGSHKFDGMDDFRSTLNLVMVQFVAASGAVSKALQRRSA